MTNTASREASWQQWAVYTWFAAPHAHAGTRQAWCRLPGDHGGHMAAIRYVKMLRDSRQYARVELVRETFEVIVL